MSRRPVTFLLAALATSPLLHGCRERTSRAVDGTANGARTADADVEIAAAGHAAPSSRKGGDGETRGAAFRASADADGTQSRARDVVAASASPLAVDESRSVPRVTNVLLLTIDAFRGDQPWTGYDLARTPALSDLAARGIIYTHAYATANLTTASLASMMSGRYASELYRDRCSIGYYRFRDGLAATLTAAGVATTASHGHAIFAGRQAPSEGFAEWRLIDHAAGVNIRSGDVTGEAVGRLMEETLRMRPAETPFFAWAHLVDPHDAYVTHEAFPASASPVRGAYDGEVAYTDHVIAGILRALAESPHATNTAVLVTGDHGEAFGEHGTFRHGRTVFDEEVRVPLLVLIPGVAPRRIDTPRSTIDVPNTVATLLGVTPPAHWRGRSLLDDLGEEGAASRAVVVDAPETDVRGGLQAVVMGRTKVVFDGQRRLAFDLGADPGEMSPLPGPQTTRAATVAQGTLARLVPAASEPCR